MTKVLIADDSIAVRKVAERLLTEAGFGVALAANGAEALAYLAKETPDLVVSDVIMPDKSGYEVCAFVRGQKAIANTPVLLISGIVNDEVTKQAESCHADGVLKKPFQGTSLKDRVIELLAKRQGAAAPAAKSIEKGTESNQPIQNARVSDEQLATYQRATARLKALEEELLVERDRATRSAQRVVQLEGELGHAQELEPMLAKEREQITQLKMQLAETERSVAQVQELESALKTERDRTAEAKNQASLAKSLGERVRELEMALQKERDDRAQQATGFAELQKQASRVQELEATLQAERQAAAQLVEQMTEMEQAATRSQVLTQQVGALEQSLAAEQQRSKDLAMRLSEAERAAKTTSEGDALLQTERERNGLLVKRVSEAEQAAEQATKRFEEMAIKLGEIAGLASQLGSGKRRS
jgi:DNA-binding response OmpR family regulator